MPNFNEQNYIDPTSIATVMQRRAAMEFEQNQAARTERGQQVTRLLEAVTTGQKIASNMMDLAEKRREVKATNTISGIMKEPVADPTLSPTRSQRMLDAISQRSPKEFDKSMLEAANPDKERGFAPQQASIELKNGKITPAAFINGKYYYPNSDEIIPPEEIAGKGYGLVPMQNADGSVTYVSRSTARGLGKQSTAPDAPAIIDKKPVKNAVNMLEKGEVDRLDKLKEDFNADLAVKTALSKQADYQMAKSVVGIGNWVGDAAVLSVAAKGLGRDVGNLSEQEQNRYRLSPAIWEGIKTKANLWAKGIIRPEDREAFKEAVRVMDEKNEDILNKKLGVYSRTAKTRIKNLDEDFAKNYLYDQRPSNKDLSSKPIEEMSLEELDAEEKRIMGSK